MKKMKKMKKWKVGFALVLIAIIGCFPSLNDATASTLLNVSFDPTRALFKDYNALFKAHLAKSNVGPIQINQSHGGSGKQARSVIDGVPADVLTLATGSDLDEVQKRTHLFPANWQSKLPNNSSPYWSTIVFVVRKGNPKKIRDWSDLVKPGISVITPNPKTSGGARWNYLAAWSFAEKNFGHNPAKSKTFVQQLFKNVPVLDTGARGSSLTFSERKMGDVLIAWESDALLLKTKNPGHFEIIIPSLSIKAEPPVAVVEKNAKSHGVLGLSQQYLTYMYTPEAQTLIAKHHFRPSNPTILKKFSFAFPTVNLVTIQELGGWDKVSRTHFSEGGIFDQITTR